MKKLLKNIVISFITAFLLSSSLLFANEAMVPKSQFDEVFNQLIISNDQLKTLDQQNKDLVSLVSSRDLKIKDLEKTIVSLQEENSSLIKENEDLKEAKTELVEALSVSTEQLALEKAEREGLATLLTDSNKRLEESNLLISKKKTYSLGGGVSLINSSLGGYVDFSYLLFKGFSIDTGIAYAYPLEYSVKLGVSFLW